MEGKCGYSAILADEMGLGKTLQTITVVWTLLSMRLRVFFNFHSLILLFRAVLLRQSFFDYKQCYGRSTCHSFEGKKFQNFITNG